MASVIRTMVNASVLLVGEELIVSLLSVTHWPKDNTGDYEKTESRVNVNKDGVVSTVTSARTTTRAEVSLSRAVYHQLTKTALPT